METRWRLCHRSPVVSVIRVSIQETDFSIEEEWDACRERMKGKAGAIAAFAGLVRDSVQESGVKGLYLEHYPGMTESSIRDIVKDAMKQWSLLDVVVIHRIGLLRPEDQIVLVLVGSSHRMDAFAACERIMDYLKTEAVFWKKEIRDKDETWISSTTEDYRRRDSWRANKTT